MKKRIAFTVALCALFVVGTYIFMNARTLQLFGPLVHRVETPERMVALTFDDGPTPGETEEILRTLSERGASATFFLVGREVDAYPESARAIIRAGHEVGNHTYTHQRMILKSPGFVQQELERTDASLRRLGHEHAIHFRPPYGKKLISLPWVLSKRQTTTVMWDIEPESHAGVAKDANKIVDHVMERVQPGSIILLHVMHDQEVSRASVGPLIDRLHGEGYKLVTVSELLRQRAASPP